LQQIITQQEAAERELKQAESMEAMVASWQSDIDAAATVACPTEDEVAKAEVEVMAANAAIETGIKIRQAITAQELAAEYAEEAKTHARAAQRLRDAAHDTHDVLAEAVAKIPNCPLSVKLDDDGNARLVVPARDDEPFDRLSDGERWPLILQIAAASNRLITLSQAAYGELSARTRKQLHDLAVQHGCYILTASIDEGELRCTPYVNEPAEELAAT
jgi:hypothetical protein